MHNGSPIQIILNVYSGMGPMAGMLHQPPAAPPQKAEAPKPKPKPKPKKKKKTLEQQLAHPNPAVKDNGNKTLRELMNSGV